MGGPYALINLGPAHELNWPEGPGAKAMMSAMIIAIEGGDMTGKATQSGLLCDELKRRGLDARLLHFPDYETRTGAIIRGMLGGPGRPDLERLHTLLAENRLERLPEIESAPPGSVLVMDRYVDSNMAYGLANGMDPVLLERLDKRMPAPDLVVLLDMDPGAALKREASGRDHFERIGLARKVRAQYLKLAGERGWKVVDAGGEVGDVHRSVLDRVVPELPPRGGRRRGRSRIGKQS